MFDLSMMYDFRTDLNIKARALSSAAGEVMLTEVRFDFSEASKDVSDSWR